MTAVPPGYNTEVPASIMTPDRVDTRIGALEFFDGIPTPETSRTVYDHLDFARAVEAFLNFIPAASVEGLRRGLASIGVDACHRLMLMDRLMDSTPLFLTGNTDTVYCGGMLDLGTDGPTVIEVPPGCGPGTVDDAFFRFVVDLGAPGPDRGQGGKYLVVPDDFDGDLPDGYFVARSPSSTNVVILRGFLVDGKPDAAAEMFRSGLRIYPLHAADDPPAMEFISTSEMPFNTVHANDASFYDEVADVLAREPVDFLDPELRGLAASIGIRKDQPFEPDDRMAAILAEGAAVGNATARAIVFDTRDRASFIYDDRRWQTVFPGGDYQWLLDGGVGGRDLDSRVLFFYQATVNTPAMALEMVGAGSQYAVVTRDRDGQPLDGSGHYTLEIPPDVPAADFWSVVVYDPQTRSELQTGQPFPSKNDARDDLVREPDGSVVLHFSPTPPESGHTDNWIQTVAGKAWYPILRLYGPLQSWFDKSWRPGDIEPAS
ncbi:DUF1254 domain-containing protein [Salsipaludibacter albus]|uniref:DUF1254 domain-containing protein n=1 Tax=Salsipaludibacter albus TaxID=2849650 RepID=UPI001EE45A48|nr:DUF1254 domain-containing protein [Salsipaludibacter albus]